ncbi:hypothetical protein GCM10014713_13690 [Streptomyces purpureus]|uniref:DUF2797 domain-containing protein n=1 Tax=Streptomyces purpureus TaxID=1951 RepID=A0A918GZI0_9ACTN|nr:hypothetical protein GCM10014713_13690 [Streptomyces purpureus]
MWGCRGLRWGEGAPVLQWEGGRGSRLEYGQVVAFRGVGERVCLGVRGRGCPFGAVVGGRSTGGQCEECARLDRSRSVAADTLVDDPRTYRVYLAWFGPGMVKVGITAEERGAARLLEQGAVVFGWLGRGPLMAARRTEELLRHALGVPDRIPYARKRAVRAVLPGPGERRREVEELYGRAVGLAGWAETLEVLELGVVDHAGVFGLDAVTGVDGVVTELVDDGSVVGELVAAAGPDLHLVAGGGRRLVLDTRLMAGWGLVAAGAGDGVSVPVKAVAPGVQGGLF